MRNPFTLTPGQPLSPATFAITPEEARAYAQAVGDASALYRRPEAPLPPLLLAARALRLLMAQVDIPPGTVHGGQDCEFFQAAYAGRDLRLTASVPRAATRQGQRFLTLELELRAGEALICRGRALLIVPQDSTPTAAPGARVAVEQSREQGAATNVSTTGPTAATAPGPLRAGTRLVQHRVVTQEQIDAYAIASGDHNPLHTDPAFAATTALGGPVAHGMLVLAWLSALLTAHFPADWPAHGSFRIRFRAPARPGDRLEVGATVRRVEDSPAGRRATLDLLVANQRQEPVIDGTGSLLLGDLTP
jgi:acyl dehydratase